jgi:ABC-type Fe3+-hydroxamate transport system substrate-binding protein
MTDRQYPKLVTDQLQHVITLPAAPKRIISLVPSQTELLFDLGLEEEVVGITKFCIHPNEWFKSKVRVGGTKQYDFDKIKALAPDLIIGNKEENEEQGIRQLMQHYPVWMSDVKNVEEALKMIIQIGELVNKQEKAAALAKQIGAGFDALALEVAKGVSEREKTAAYFIWRKPYMVAGHSTFINEMLRCCNLNNSFEGQQSRYPEVTPQALVAANPEVVLLSSEPFPFKEKHIDELNLLLPHSKIKIVDGELFSWYGSRLLHTPLYLSQLHADFYC